MSTSTFALIMVVIVVIFIWAMIWAYRRNDYKEKKPQVAPQNLNTLDDTLKTITVYSDAMIKEQEEEQKKKAEEEKKEKDNDPLAKMELLESRRTVIQNKNHIKKSAADEYFEKTKNVANEILKPKTK